MSDLASYSPLIGDEQIHLLERLCNACAVSGAENEVRTIVIEELQPYANDLKIDAMGNVLVTRHCQEPGENPPLRVMLAAHMDEVGMMLTYAEGEGIFRFDTVGGVDPRQLAGKVGLVGKKHAPGVIGLGAIHLSSVEERRSSITLDGLRIDVGPGNATAVKVGDRATFATQFCCLGPSIRAKALDDRLGVATLIELVKHAPANIELQAAFTVQEEVGLRGARVAAYAFNPDLALALDSTPVHDLPGWDAGQEDASENAKYNARLGAGPAIYTVDAATLSDPRLIRFLVETAESAGIPYQFRQPGGGGTDAGAIHKTRAGIPVVSLSVPGRYMHTAAGLTLRSDWEHSLALIYTALSRLSPAVLTRER